MLLSSSKQIFVYLLVHSECDDSAMSLPTATFVIKGPGTDAVHMCMNMPLATAIHSKHWMKSEDSPNSRT